MNADAQLAAGVYGKSNGNGPLHLLTDDGQGTLCGLQRFEAIQFDPWPGQTLALCGRCASRRRREQQKPDLHAIAEIYRQALDVGEYPVTAVMRMLGKPRSTAGRYVSRARQAGLLPATRQGSARGHAGSHAPRRARWLDETSSWLACADCKQPWPCVSSEEATQ